MTRGKSHHKVCAVVFPETGQVCTKKPGHYDKVRSLHSNEKPGYEVTWDEDGNVQRNPH